MFNLKQKQKKNIYIYIYVFLKKKLTSIVNSYMDILSDHHAISPRHK